MLVIRICALVCVNVMIIQPEYKEYKGKWNFDDDAPSSVCNDVTTYLFGERQVMLAERIFSLLTHLEKK